MAKRGRPPEPKRVKLTLRVLPKTELAITRLVKSSDKALNTLGKIVDKQFL
jgi:hypothetical protein